MIRHRVWGKILLLACAVLMTGSAHAQNEVEMADQLRESGKIYVVVVVVLLILLGVLAYLFTLDRKLTRLERDQEEPDSKHGQ